MYSASYDLVIEIHRQLYNKILQEIYKTNPVIANKKRRFYSYELRLDKAPTVDSLNKSNFFFTIELNTKISLLKIIRVNIDSVAHLVISIQIDNASKRLKAKILKSTLKMKPRKDGNNIIVRHSLRLYNQLLNFVIDSRLSHHYEKLALSPSLYSFTLPDLERENISPIQLDIVDVSAVNRDVTAILINLLGRTDRSANVPIDYTAGQDISFSLSANAMDRAKKYWWRNPNKQIIDEIRGKLDITPDIPLELITRLGLALDDLIERHTLPVSHEIRRWWIDYWIKVKLGEPNLVLKEGNEIEIPGLEIKLDIDADLQLLVTAPNANEKDITITATKFTERDLELIVKEAIASIHLNSNYCIVAKLVKLNTELNLNWGVPTEVLNLFLDRLEEHIIQLFSDIVISPAIITENIPGTGLQFKFDLDQIKTSKDEIIIGGSFETS